MTFFEILPGILQLSHQNNNVYLVQSQGWTLIDTGPEEMGVMILEGLQKKNLHPSDLGRILLTHAHSECTGAAGFLKQKTRAQAHCHIAEAQLLENGIAVRPNFQTSPGLQNKICLLYTSPSPRDLSTSRMPSSA